MASARGDALDWALALARAPGERHALRQRPLPDGIDALMQIAGGSHGPVLADAETHTGLSSAELVDAARFYLREVLFFPDADAYRVLGLADDASDEQIKHHHRLLLQWLHPDRPTSDWDAAFAARVNAAWSQLRTRARRAVYAAGMMAVASPAASEPSWGQPNRIHVPVMVTDSFDAGRDEDRWRRRAPVLALFGVCVVLGVLAVRDMQREPDTGLAGIEIAKVTSTEETAAVSLQLPAPASVAKPAPPKRATAPRPRTTPVAVAAAKPVAKPVVPPVAVTVARKPVAPRIAVAAAPKPVAAKPIASRPVAPVVALPSKPVAVALAPARKSVVAAALVPMPVRKPVPVIVAASPKAAPVPTSPLKPVAKAATAATVAKPAVPAVPAAAVAKPVPARIPEPKPAAPPPVAVAVAPVAVPAAPSAANSPAQVAQAQQTGQRLLTFVAGRGGGIPPIWANYATQTQASRAREALQGGGRIAVGAPDWRVGGSSAAMQASLTPRGGAARRLRVDLVWREQRWLVTGLALEQAP